MQNAYPRWKYWFIAIITVVGFIYALPNLYGEDPVVEISLNKTATEKLDDVLIKTKQLLTSEKIKTKADVIQQSQLIFRFYNTDDQLKAQDLIKNALGESVTVAINISPATPSWLSALGAEPMKYGLDLRGGVHFMLDVDIHSVVARREEGMLKNISQAFREEKLRFQAVNRTKDKGVIFRFANQEVRDKAAALVMERFPEFVTKSSDVNRSFDLSINLSPTEIQNMSKYTIEQTMSILRNRVNELGVGEAVVQQQGANRIAVDLPGIQDAARAKQVLGGTATLEFHLVDQEHDPLQTGSLGLSGVKRYTYQGSPVLLKNQVILSGDSITSAMATVNQQTGLPAVAIQLGGGGESLFNRITGENVGKLLGIVFVETKSDLVTIDGKTVHQTKKQENVIMVATIQSALGSGFEITGLKDMNESRDLALMLRAGALPAAIYPVEERTVGPSLGKENIERGLKSLMVGLSLILIVMVLYYHLFGLIADIALVFNLILLVAILSLIDATLTLPGIAGIVLTLGMAVDANVLINERIREELRLGMTPQAAIYAGYERAFSTIIDANLTTLIVALVLFGIGTGPIKGFAVTLTVGLLTSMITGIIFTRAMVNLIYGGRRQVKRLSIGI